MNPNQDPTEDLKRRGSPHRSDRIELSPSIVNCLARLNTTWLSPPAGPNVSERLQQRHEAQNECEEADAARRGLDENASPNDFVAVPWVDHEIAPPEFSASTTR